MLRRRGILRWIGVVGLLAVAAGVGSASPCSCGKKAVSLRCPVEGTTIKQKSKALSLKVNDRPVYVCCAGCAEKLKADPAQYLTKPVKDPVNGKSFKVTAETPTVERGGVLFLFSGETTKTTFEQSPERYAH